MRLLVIRHGKAEERDPDRWSDDSQRPLIEKGHAESRQLGKFLDAHDLIPLRCWSSPLVRAWQTAEGIASGAPGWPTPEADDRLGFDFSPDGLLDAIRQANTESLALIGHEPDLSHFINWLIGARTYGGVEMKKGTLAILELNEPLLPGTARLQALVTPKLQGT